MLMLFWLAVFFVIYTYLIFPVLLECRTRVMGFTGSNQMIATQPTPVADEELPTVSVLIAAHNENDKLPEKLLSLRAQDYPVEKLQLVVVSDGSSDGTVEYLQKQDDIVWDHYEPAAGKPTALNRAVSLSTGEFLVFTDARQALSTNAVRALVGRFENAAVGAVSGELVMSDDGLTEAANVGLYWQYEKWIRLNEARLFSTTGATGALYAIRRQDAVELAPDTLLDDFETPIALLKRRKRTLFEPSAIAFDRAEADAGREFIRKSRTLAGNFQSFSRNKWLFLPQRNPVWWQFLSHKVARLLVPYALILAFVSAAFGDGLFLSAAFWIQGLFYGAGLAAMLFPALAKNKILNIIKVFLQLNAAAVIGARNYLTGQSSVRWRNTSP